MKNRRFNFNVRSWKYTLKCVKSAKLNILYIYIYIRYCNHEISIILYTYERMCNVGHTFNGMGFKGWPGEDNTLSELQHVSGIKGLALFVYQMFIGGQLASFVKSTDLGPSESLSLTTFLLSNNIRINDEFCVHTRFVGL